MTIIEIFNNIANSIRSKLGISSKITPSNYSNEISKIVTNNTINKTSGTGSLSVSAPTSCVLTVTTTAGASVYAYNSTVGNTSTVTANTSGKATLTLSRGGSWTIYCSKTGYTSKNVTIAYVTSSTVSCNCVLSANCTILMVNTTAGATVTATKFDATSITATANTSGVAVLTLTSAGTWTITATKSGFVQNSISINAVLDASTSSITLELSPYNTTTTGLLTVYTYANAISVTVTNTLTSVQKTQHPVNLSDGKLSYTTFSLDPGSYNIAVTITSSNVIGTFSSHTVYANETTTVYAPSSLESQGPAVPNI